MSRNLNLKSYYILLSILFVLLALNSLISPMFSYGDAHSDADVAIAGENFHDYGMSNSYWLPVLTQRGSYQLCEQQGIVCVYTHYPPFPYWLNGWLRDLGFENIFYFRVLALLLSLAAALMVPRVFSLILQNPSTVALASMIYILNPIFLGYADSLQQFPWNHLCLMLFLFFWIRFLRTPRPQYLLIAILSFFVNTWVTFEYFAFMPVIAGLSVLLEKKLKTHWWAVGLVGATAVLTLILRVWHQSTVFGTWQASLHELLFAADVRKNLTWPDFFKGFQARFIDFVAPGILIFITAMYLQSKKKIRIEPYAQAWALMFLVAGLFWWFLMRQHAVVHAHTSQMFLPFFAVYTAILLQALLPLMNTHKWVRILWAISCVFYIGKALQTKTFSRFVPLNPKEYRILKSTESSLLALQEYGMTTKDSSSPILIDEESHPLAYHVKRDFRYFSRDQVCKDATNFQTVVATDKKEDYVNRCKSLFGEPRKLGEFALFLKQ